jgi:phosphoglycolate phosphatase-like HAD superfamily hydrolase
MPTPTIYALDFDGVICDSAVETAITGWQAAATLWPDMPTTAPDTMVEKFRHIRPIIETGYEAILAMRLLHLNMSSTDIFGHYAGLMQDMMQQANLSVAQLKDLFGNTRDTWIAQDLPGWIQQNPLFEGMAAKLQQLGQQHTWYIITTKQERFVKHILAANAIFLPDTHIFGLDRQLSKIQVLGQLVDNHPNSQIVFVEDRLPTLLNVAKQTNLASIELVLALWGYNTEQDKATARQHPLKLQLLADFL